MRSKPVISLGIFFAIFLIGHCQDLCLPRLVLTTSVRATLYRASNQVLSVCTSVYDEFRGELAKIAASNISLGDGCTLLSVGENTCVQKGQCYFHVL